MRQILSRGDRPKTHTDFPKDMTVMASHALMSLCMGITLEMWDGAHIAGPEGGGHNMYVD
jgi:hypothetical protein